jgi:hypothetical protein
MQSKNEQKVTHRNLLKKEITMKKEIKMTKLMTVFLATLIIGLPWAAAAPKSDGYYGKTKVAPGRR